MPDDDIIDAPVEGDDPTPEPEPDDAGTPPESDAPLTDEPSDDDEPAAPPAEDVTETDEWKALEQKYAKIEDEDERKRVIGKQYWEKVRYASQLRKENEQLRRERDEARAARAKAAERPEEPPPPHPDIQSLDARIGSLEARDKEAYDEQNNCLTELDTVKQEIAKLEAKIEDADEWGRAILEQRKETLTMRRGNLDTRFRDLADRRDGLRYEHGRLQQERSWTAKLLKDAEARQNDERQSAQRFEQEFPREVAASIVEVATEMKLPVQNKALRDDLIENVKMALGVTLFRMEERGVNEVDVDGMVRKLVQRYAQSRDLARRTTFAATSRAKQQVSGQPPTSARPAARPAASKDVTALGVQDLPDGMAKARARLGRVGL